MRTLAACLLAALLLPGAAHATDLEVLKRLTSARSGRTAGAAGAAGADRLPLPGRYGPSPDDPQVVGTGLADRHRPTRILISVRAHADVPGVIEAVRRAGGEDLRTLNLLGVVAGTYADPAALVAALAGDRRVVAIERDVKRELTADPADAIDPETGIPYAWHLGAVRAREALAAVGGRSRFGIAVVDSGADLGHADFGPHVTAGGDVVGGSADVSDEVGHGTFVTGLIAATPDNGEGLAGVAGTTPTVVYKIADAQGRISSEAVATAVQAAIRAKLRVINLSLGGAELTESESRALSAAFLEDVLPVAAAGNNAQEGNDPFFPAAALTAPGGALAGIGLSVGATLESGAPAAFSTHNRFVSIAAPGAQASGCPYGVFSTAPRNAAESFDAGLSCSPNFNSVGESRYAYSQGTSFAAPIVAGIASIAWEAEPRLKSEQVVKVLLRSARQTFGTETWNEFTGRGVVDAAAAVALARRFDVTAPTFRRSITRAGRGRVRVRVSGGRDRTEAGRELAGRVRYTLARVTARGVKTVIRGSARPIDRVVRAPSRSSQLAFGACDANGNCRFLRRR